MPGVWGTRRTPPGAGLNESTKPDSILLDIIWSAVEGARLGPGVGGTGLLRGGTGFLFPAIGFNTVGYLIIDLLKLKS